MRFSVLVGTPALVIVAQTQLAAAWGWGPPGSGRPSGGPWGSLAPSAASAHWQDWQPPASSASSAAPTSSAPSTSSAPPSPSATNSFCLSDSDAQIVAENFGQSISNYSEALAVAVFSVDFVDQSDSVNSLIDSGTQSPIPLGNVTFASRAAFIQGQGAQPLVPFTLLNVWHTCDHVFFRWVSKQKPQQVQGIDIAEVTPQTNSSLWAQYGKYQIKSIYAEFNSAAWIQDPPGNCTITCPPLSL